MWNPSLSTPAKLLEFSNVEIARIRNALQTWDSYATLADRRWFELLAIT